MKNEIGVGVNTPIIIYDYSKFTGMSKEGVFEGFFSLRKGGAWG